MRHDDEDDVDSEVQFRSLAGTLPCTLPPPWVGACCRIAGRAQSEMQSRALLLMEEFEAELVKVQGIGTAPDPLVPLVPFHALPLISRRGRAPATERVPQKGKRCGPTAPHTMAFGLTAAAPISQPMPLCRLAGSLPRLPRLAPACVLWRRHAKWPDLVGDGSNTGNMQDLMASLQELRDSFTRTSRVRVSGL